MTIFKILDTLHQTATGPDGIPSWFLKIGAPFFSAPIADIINLSLQKSVVPSQWKKATIIPIAKNTNPQTECEYRPISITSVLSRITERIIVRNHIYPSLNYPPLGLKFTDQFAFQPTGSTTAALIQLLHFVTTMLERNPYVIVYAIDFSKAFDSVRHNEMLCKFSRMELPDNVYNWLVDFFCERTHCTRYNDKNSQSLNITASVIQGSAIGPASFVIAASDLQPITDGNEMVKYADDIYLIIPASNNSSCADEIENVENWGKTNNLQLNR
jgi:gmma-aminobutyric acid receptor subunit gamma/cGMP-dependent protein kinase 2